MSGYFFGGRIMVNVMKRDGTVVPFERSKVEIAIRKANYEAGFRITEKEVQRATDNTLEVLRRRSLIKTASVEDIQDAVITALYDESLYLGETYESYSKERNRVRGTDDEVLSLIDQTNEALMKENSNKNGILTPTQRDLIAGIVSKDISRRLLLPKHLVKAHDQGIIHMHDMDYMISPMHNCCLVNLEDMLQNGTVINEKMIETPKSLRTAATVTSQIIAQVASSQYGGQTISLAHLAPFVDVSRQRIKKDLKSDFEAMGIDITGEFYKLVERRVAKEIKDSIQTIQYQLETLSSTNGQSPFATINMDLNEAKNKLEESDLALLIEEVLRQRIVGTKNENGVYAAPAFPKLIYVLDEFNTYEESEYFYLTKLAAECSSKRLVPDYISAKKMRELKEGNVYPPMGCRSFLTPDYKDPETGEYKYYGRWNNGVTTLNIPDAALSSGGDIDKFWNIIDERMKLIKEAQLFRHNKMKGVQAKVSPILWQHGAIARLKPEDKIDDMLYNGYSTSSIGVIGIFEAVLYLTGESHTAEAGKKLGLEILQRINDIAAEWREEYNIHFSVYGTPSESLTDKFAKSLQKRFGNEIENITDKGFVQNSYHVDVKEPINAFDKLTFEAEFQDLTPGGAISYVELPDMKKNLEAVVALIQHIYEHTMYGELNVRADNCLVCNHEGEMLFNEKGEWYCPACGNNDQGLIQITCRVCGYISSGPMNEGRTIDVQSRVKHLGEDNELHLDEEVM